MCVYGTELTGGKGVRLAKLTFVAWDSLKSKVKQNGGVPWIHLISVILLTNCVCYWGTAGRLVELE